MSWNLSKKLAIFFYATAIIYLLSVSFINYPLTSFLKPLPIFFLIIAVLQGKINKSVKMFMLMALALSIMGDVALTLPVNTALEWGIGFFMLAHCCYITTFLKDCSFDARRCILFLPVLSLIVAAFVCLLPCLGGMQLPVIVYMFVLSTMVFTAFQVATNALVISIGALLFLSSDLLIAVNIFMFPDIDLQFVTMLTYYLAQMLLITGIIAANAQPSTDGALFVS